MGYVIYTSREYTFSRINLSFLSGRQAAVCMCSRTIKFLWETQLRVVLTHRLWLLPPAAHKKKEGQHGNIFPPDFLMGWINGTIIYLLNAACSQDSNQGTNT